MGCCIGFLGDRVRTGGGDFGGRSGVSFGCGGGGGGFGSGGDLGGWGLLLMDLVLWLPSGV